MSAVSNPLLPATRVRWTVCALIFFAMTVNYLDRQLFSLLTPFFENDLRLGPTDLALINVSFLVPYGFAMLFIGQSIDRVGIKKGLNVTYLVWNIASIGHALVRSLTGFMGARFLLGLGEAGMYPAGIKTVSEWFPQRERATAAGMINAGANMGALLAPMLGVYLATQFSWRACFVMTGIFGMIWLLFWNPMYRPIAENPAVSESEFAYIHQDPPETNPPLTIGQLFAMRPIYGLAIAKALSDAPWWFYLTWMPKFLVDQFHLSTAFMALAIPVIYIVADVGSVAGGWLSSTLLARGYDVTRARKTAMLVCALLVTPVMSVGMLVDHAPIAGIPSVYWAIGVVALAAGAHQGWSSNLFTIISDVVPRNSMAMAVGGINGFAMLGASAMQFFVGRTVQLTSSYTLPFVAAGLLYLVALVCLHVIVPRIERRLPTRSVRLRYVAIGGLTLLAGLGLLQYAVNKPPYPSLSDYYVLRRAELKASAEPQSGPDAKVGWMSGKWFRWTIPGKPPKLELVKFDGRNRPYVEAKGAGAPHYVGPSATDLAAKF